MFLPDSTPHRFLLVLRFALLNIFGFALLGVAYTQGLIATVIDADQTYLSVLIFLVFLGGLAICGRKIWQISHGLNDIQSGDPDAPIAKYLSPILNQPADSRSNLFQALKLRLSQRIAIVRNTANVLVILGLIGTVLGFIIALSGVDPKLVSDVHAIAPMISTLIRGMSTALYTTLVGAVLNVWLMTNYNLLENGTVKLITSLVEKAENHARG